MYSAASPQEQEPSSTDISPIPARGNLTCWVPCAGVSVAKTPGRIIYICEPTVDSDAKP